VRGSRVVTPLAKTCTDILAAFRSFEALPTPGGGGGTVEGSSSAKTAEDSSSLPSRKEQAPAPAPKATRPQETVKDIGFRMSVARQVAQQLARFQSKFEGTQAELIRQRAIPPRPVDVSGLPIELLIILRESLAAQRLALDVLVKSATSSGVGTSLATQEVMRLLTDPDAAMKDKFANGEVTLDEASPFERLYHIFPYASWCARVAANFFIGEVPTCVVNLLAFVKGEMSFRGSRCTRPTIRFRSSSRSAPPSARPST
jgi:hypothetical protein